MSDVSFLRNHLQLYFFIWIEKKNFLSDGIFHYVSLCRGSLSWTYSMILQLFPYLFLDTTLLHDVIVCNTSRFSVFIMASSQRVTQHQSWRSLIFPETRQQVFWYNFQFDSWKRNIWKIECNKSQRFRDFIVIFLWFSSILEIFYWQKKRQVSVSNMNSSLRYRN